MPTAVARAMIDAGLIDEPPTVRTLPPAHKRKQAADRMWLLANGLPTPEQSRRRDKVAKAAAQRAEEYRMRAWDSPGAAVVYDALNRGRHILRIVWPNGLEEEFNLFSRFDASIVIDAVDEDPALHESCFAMPVDPNRTYSSDEQAYADKALGWQ